LRELKSKSQYRSLSFGQELFVSKLISSRFSAPRSEKEGVPMFQNLISRLSRIKTTSFFAVGCVLFLWTIAGFAQTTISTGSIVGTVTDPSGAIVSSAQVEITNTQTGQKIELTSNGAGAYNSGALPPGNYRVKVSQKGFRAVEQTLVVLVGNTATANVALQVGQESEVVEVQGSQVAVNTEQAEVQGVLNAAQIENLPVNGRNFLDLAQLEPGVQIQDGQNFDPTKSGYSSISFGGRFGRTARINVDGVDISDETVGTTTQDIPASAIDEFQLGQSTLDLSNDLTSSGAINVSTKSGTNDVHGGAFGLFRDHSMNADTIGGDEPFQRSQFGGDVGGPIIKNKLFFFADGERTKQDSLAPVSFAAPFDTLSGGFNQAFRETDLIGKLDYQFHGAHLFYRFSYFQNSLPSDFGLGFAVFDNKDISRNHVVGADFNTGSFTHSIRFSYLKFQNQIADAVLGSSLPFANAGVTLESFPFVVGPSPDAPQSTPQANREFKYDGSKAVHSHILRYGVSFNHIQGGGFADFFGIAPRVTWTETTANRNFADLGPFPGGDTNPLNYPVQNFRVGNGLGFNTEKPAFGFPAGGLGPDNRVGLYIGDSWKVIPNFTVTYGLRWDRDTGRTDSDLAAIPEVNAAFPGMGDPVKQPNDNFAPQLGIAWDPTKSGKTVVRAGIGLFYENVIFNNVLFDRPLRLENGAFNQTPFACLNGSVNPVLVPGGTLSMPAGACGNVAAGSVLPQLIAFSQQYQAATPVDLSAHNPNYIGDILGAGVSIPIGLFAPNYQSPRGLQMNFGIQHEIRHGMIFSADYLRNVGTHSLLGVDTNHVGDASLFNMTAAQQAIAATLTACGAGSINAAIANCANLHPTGAPGATMADFAGFGLTSSGDFGGACATNAFDPSGNPLGRPCAFGGINGNQGAGVFMEPVGRSLYNGLQLKLTQNVANPMKGLKTLNLQVSYSLSRFESSGGTQATGTVADSDQDFVIGTLDNNNVNKYFGPALLDRTHQLSFGGYGDLPGGFRLGLIGHFYSPLSAPLDVPLTGNPGEIFYTDFTGDGTTGDPIPGTKLGNFDRGINASNINKTINNYNATVAGQPTPAGQVLISNGLFTQAQLQALGGVAASVPTAPGNEVNFNWLKDVDFNLGWRYKIKERFTIEPSIAMFNVFNFANYNLPPNIMNGLLTGSAGAINGTDNVGLQSFRVGNGTGVYSLGSARQIEWGLKVDF
jgi:hypothetical protein